MKTITELFDKSNVEIINLLKTDFFDKDIVIHYICSECDDEQVTYTETIDNDFLNRIQFGDETIMFTLECTNCGFTEKFLPIGNIIAFELI